MNLEVGNALRRKKIEKPLSESLAWKTVIDVYTEKYNSSRIEKYLESVRIQGSICIIKTQKPIIISELLPLCEEIQKKLSEKFQKVGIHIKDIRVKVI